MSTSIDELIDIILNKLKGIDGRNLSIPITPELLSKFQELLLKAEDDVSKRINYFIE